MRLPLRQKIGLELARQYRRSTSEAHPLQQLFWESTLRCNVSCRHCGSDCKQLAGVKDMPREDFFCVLDSIATHTDPHHVFVIITGGEPLMRNDIIECGQGIYSRGYPWGMVTNGLVLDAPLLRLLRQAGLHSLTVSLDGLEDDHNWMRRHKGSFAGVERALKALVNEAHNGLVFDVVTCVNQRNFDTLPQIRDYLIQLGVTAWRLYSIFPVGRAANDPLMQISDTQFRDLLRFIRQTRKEGIIRAAFGCEGFLGPFEGDVRDHFFHCEAGITVGSVMADGAIAACASIRSDFNQGNIYQDDFWDVWQNRYHPHRDRTWMRTGECRDCRHWRHCEGNGLHLRDNNGHLLLCHMKRLENAETNRPKQ